MLAIALVAVSQLAIYPGLSLAAPGHVYAAVIAIMALGVPAVAHMTGHYRLDVLLNPMRNAPGLAAIWVCFIAVLAIAAFATQMGHSISRAWFLAWSVSGFGWLLAARVAAAAVVRHFNARGQLNRRAVIVGGGAEAEQAIAALQHSRDTAITLVGIFDDRSDARSPSEMRGLKKLGSINDLISFVRSSRVDTLIVTLPVNAEQRLMDIVSRLWVLPVDIRLSAQSQRLRYRPRAYSHIGNLALLDIFDKPLGEWGPLLKAIEDRLIASLALLLLSPVMALVALAVKLDSKGPVLFKQKRYGFNNELIEVYKFRSMYTDQADVDARKLVTRDDPRVTRVGRFIRKTTLDELPQLFNVLKGELSLVGPRPHATRASAAGTLYENAVQGYFARHKVKPGMTGWAQVNGWRGETDTEEKIRARVEHDLHYIENWSLTFDLYILARTPLALFNTSNAY
ncbi:MAG: undecaprenyl-phosphate glucose phosphotransferase [Rhizobiales bacterium]|nr:undecaprenyl-phosphate glucose phosphotransferase [Hyphomicrobiales bacterium]